MVAQYPIVCSVFFPSLPLVLYSWFGRSSRIPWPASVLQGPVHMRWLQCSLTRVSLGGGSFRAGEGCGCGAWIFRLMEGGCGGVDFPANVGWRGMVSSFLHGWLCRILSSNRQAAQCIIYEGLQFITVFRPMPSQYLCGGVEFFHGFLIREFLEFHL